jgi:hypothetical protein
MMFRLFITERKGNIHWNVPSRVEASTSCIEGKNEKRMREETATNGWKEVETGGGERP